MRKGVIKKVLMTASLGLALFFSGQARALEVYALSCVGNPATNKLTIVSPVASEGARHKFVVGGDCDKALVFFLGKIAAGICKLNLLGISGTAGGTDLRRIDLVDAATKGDVIMATVVAVCK